jgi:hypothetical protein
MNASITDFEMILQNFPSLISDGLFESYFLNNNTSANDEKIIRNIEHERLIFASKFNEFNICCKWLSKFKRVNTPQLSSIYLKYVVQILSNEYVCNGAIIAAALHLGFSTKYKHNDAPNFYIGISKNCPYIKMTRNLADLITSPF